jgi:hypothetical protein
VFNLSGASPSFSTSAISTSGSDMVADTVWKGLRAGDRAATKNARRVISHDFLRKAY